MSKCKNSKHLELFCHVFASFPHVINDMNHYMQPTDASDAVLVADSLTGNREAFSQIVARYQSLICSMAYSRTGSLTQSEDLAQETFIVAWKELAGLHEPHKLRHWLCGISRNLISGALQKQGREPSHGGESLDQILEPPSPEPLPVERAISREETEMLWRALERIPESYREPLILFYREHQSIQAVAEKLDLTEDNVRQRLSRGRKLLQEQLLSFVEGALARTNPGQAFTLGVLAALPITLASSAKAATIAAAAAKGGATATGTGSISTVLGILAGPALGFLAGFLGWREGLKNMRTPRERFSYIRFGIIVLGGGVLFFAAWWIFSDYVSPRLWNHHPVLTLALLWAMLMAWVVFAFGYSWRHIRTMIRLREEERRNHPELFRDERPTQAWEYRSRATLFGLPLVHSRAFGSYGSMSGRRPGEKVRPAVGWIAFGERAYGILYASGGIAVGGIANGGLSIGLLSFGGVSIGLLAFGGLAIGALALGGGAIGLIASGGLALGWHAALGGVVAAHDLACGGAALGAHVNDAVARNFFMGHRWLDFTQAGPRNLFWILCFGPMFAQMVFWIWWRRKILKRATQL